MRALQNPEYPDASVFARANPVLSLALESKPLNRDRAAGACA